MAPDQPDLSWPEGAESVPATKPLSRSIRGTILAGRYKLMEQVGEGGMGAVWVAEQSEPVKRRVAIKLIKPGMDTREVLSRFEAERQALALMDHPNIAKVHDGGMTDEGRPFFVMEYVKGVPITEYCDNARLPVAERLKLFIPVCQAVQHAHQKGVIHRDLKPSNILVSLYDGQPVPKVIDFGLAKATGASLTEHTLYTAHGLMVGTPLYMSPEQAEFNNLDIDTRTDIYSLGVILYELLTGATPLERKQIKEAAFQEILRLIKEVEPAKPSTKLSSSANLPSVAAQRGLEPAQLSRLVRGELDWIVMKSLDKERSRRYETANGLARDIERYLKDEPVEASPPSATYRLRKLARKHRGLLSTAAAIAALLVLGIAASTWQAVRATRAETAARNSETAARHASEAERAAKEQAVLAAAAEQQARQQAEAAAEAEKKARQRAESAEATARANEQEAKKQRDRAEQERQIANAVKDFLENRLLVQAHPSYQANSLLQEGGPSYSVKENPTVRELVDRAAARLIPEKIETQFPKMPLVQAEILYTIGRAYAGIGENEAALSHLERARAIYIAQGSDDRNALETVRWLAPAYMGAGRVAEGISLLEQVRDKRIEKLGPDHPDTLVSINQMAMVYQSSGRTAEAIALFEQVRDKRIEKLGPNHDATLDTINYLARAYVSSDRVAEGISLLEQVRDKRIEKLGPDHLDTLATLNGLAAAYGAAGRTAEAIALYEQIRDKQTKQLGRDHDHTLWTLQGLATEYRNAGRTAESIALYKRVCDKRTEKLGFYDPDTLVVLHDLAWAYEGAGRASDAVSLLEDFREKLKVKPGPNHPDTLRVFSHLATAYKIAGQINKAIPLFEQVRDKQIEQLGPDHLDTLTTLNELAFAYAYAGRSAEAISLYEQVRDRRIEKLGPDHPDTLQTLDDLAMSHEWAGHTAEAIVLHEQVRSKRIEKLGPDHPATLWTLHHLAIAYRNAGRKAESISLLEQVRDKRIEKLGFSHFHTLIGLRELASSYESAGRWAEAFSLYERVRDKQVDISGPAAAETLRTFSSLARLRATCPDERYRDGQQAVELATRVCTLTEWKNAGYLDTLAAAHAESGDFAKAVEWQEKAIAIWPANKGFRARLELYKSGQPYREPPAAPSNKSTDIIPH